MAALQTLLLVPLLITLNGAAQAQQAPAGERLRTLAERLDVDIGYAARYAFTTLAQFDRYQEITSREFNIVTPENSLKWDALRPAPGGFDFRDMDVLRRYADEHGMAMHGHPLVWHRQIPLWLNELDSEAMEPLMLAHITEVVQRYAGRVSVWDVVNEPLADFKEFAPGALPDPPFQESVFLEAIGPGYIDQAFRAARSADPGAVLLLNEFDVGWLNSKSDALYALAAGMLEREVPLDGIGLQMHLLHTFADAEGFSANMQRFVDLGLDIYITEFDVGVLSTDDYVIQGEIYEEVMARCLLQPRCRALQVWGVDDFHSFRPYVDPLPYDDSFNEKPAYFGLQRALSSWPLHVEQCDTGTARVASGSVYFNGTMACPAASLSGQYQRVSVRYRNPGVDAARLTVRSGTTVLGEIDLPPVAPGEQGEHATIDMALGTVTRTDGLELDLTGAASVTGIDGLLFRDPAASVLNDMASTPPAVVASDDDAASVPDEPAEPAEDPAPQPSPEPDNSDTHEGGDTAEDAAPAGSTAGSGGGPVSWLLILLAGVAGARRRV